MEPLENPAAGAVQRLRSEQFEGRRQTGAFGLGAVDRRFSLRAKKIQF